MLEGLKALADQPLPFARYIVPGYEPRDPSKEIKIFPPGYITSNTLYDFTHLCDSKSPPVRLLENVKMAERDSFPEYLLEDLSSLDSSQVKALRSALTEELSLIQGPPGTGK